MQRKIHDAVHKGFEERKKKSSITKKYTPPTFFLLFISQQSERIDYNPNKFSARKTAADMAPQHTRSREVT